MKPLVSILTILLVTTQVFAQIRIPASSPVARIEQDFGLGSVSISYTRPSAKGRIIFGDIVPYDQMWRLGSNGTTKFTVTEEVKLEGNIIFPGKYSLYAIPGKLEWTMIVYRDTAFLGEGYKDYKQENDLVRFKIKPVLLPYKIETFSIGFTNITTGSATLEIAWENVLLPIKMESDVDAKIMSSIQSALNPGPLANNYFTAANYYYESGKDITQALEWATAAAALRPEAFWMSHLRAKIQLKVQDYAAAVETATKSLEQAQLKSNDEYVRMNEKLIAEAKAKAATKPAVATGTKLGVKPTTAKPATGTTKPATAQKK